MSINDKNCFFNLFKYKGTSLLVQNKDFIKNISVTLENQ